MADRAYVTPIGAPVGTVQALSPYAYQKIVAAVLTWGKDGVMNA